MYTWASARGEWRAWRTRRVRRPHAWASDVGKACACGLERKASDLGEARGASKAGEAHGASCLGEARAGGAGCTAWRVGCTTWVVFLTDFGL